MKTINNILKTIMLISILTLSSCKSDDAEAYDPDGATITDKFTINGSEFETTKAYLIIWKDGTEFSNEYSFIFTDGKVKEDLANGLKLSTATNHFTMINVITSGANVATEQDVIDRASVIATRVNLSDDTMATTSIANWNNAAMYGSVQCGDPDQMVSYLKYGVNVGNFTTNSFTANLATRTGTIDCEYFFKDSSGTEVIGTYNGSFEIINDNF